MTVTAGEFFTGFRISLGLYVLFGSPIKEIYADSPVSLPDSEKPFDELEPRLEMSILV
jgi:hypothetical protein